MKCQTLFSGKNKKNIINLPSTENADRVVKVKTTARMANSAQPDQTASLETILSKDKMILDLAFFSQ